MAVQSGLVRGRERERESKVGRLKTIVVRGKVAFKPTNGKES